MTQNTRGFPGIYSCWLLLSILFFFPVQAQTALWWEVSLLGMPDKTTVTTIANTYGLISCNSGREPKPRFSVFKRLNPNGVWRPLVSDTGTFDIGTLNDLALAIPKTSQLWYADADADGYGNPDQSVESPFNLPGYVLNNLDCDDTNSAINPAAVELCNGLDDDCNGIPDDFMYTFEGEGLPLALPDNATIVASVAVNTAEQEIKDLNVVDLHISHTWIGDLNVVLRSPDGTEVTLFQGLCGNEDDIRLNFDDEAANTYGQIPCPATDNGWYQPKSPLSAFIGLNPNGVWSLLISDESAGDVGILNDWKLVFPESLWYTDADADGYGNPDQFIQTPCSPGYVLNNLDCDDTNAAINPGVEEICNGLDDDCNGVADDLVIYTFEGEGLPLALPDFATKAASLTVSTTAQEILDLNVLNLNINHTFSADLKVALRSPDGTEVTLFEGLCDSFDNFLLNFDDEAVNTYDQILCPATNNGWYQPKSPLSAFNGLNPNGVWTLLVSDISAIDVGTLNDWALVFPESPQAWYADADADGYGNPDQTIQSPCSLSGYVLNNLDCDDTNAAINPAAEEILNGLDDDCDNMADDSISVGVSDQWGEIQFALMPNPADRYLDLTVPGNESTGGSVALLNEAGQVVLSKQVTITPGGWVRLSIDHLPQGMYYMRLIREDGAIGAKIFMLQRE